MGLEFTPRLLKEVYLADMQRIDLELLSKLSSLGEMRIKALEVGRVTFVNTKSGNTYVQLKARSFEERDRIVEEISKVLNIRRKFGRIRAVSTRKLTEEELDLFYNGVDVFGERIYISPSTGEWIQVRGLFLSVRIDSKGRLVLNAPSDLFDELVAEIERALSRKGRSSPVGEDEGMKDKVLKVQGVPVACFDPSWVLEEVSVEEEPEEVELAFQPAASRACSGLGLERGSPQAEGFPDPEELEGLRKMIIERIQEADFKTLLAVKSVLMI